MSGDEKTGAEIVKKSLEAPLFRIAVNAGQEGAVIVNTVKNSNVGVGYNALTDEYVNMVEAGILDPVKVSRSALQNANSIAATLLTTESAVSIIKEPEPAPAGAAAWGHDVTRYPRRIYYRRIFIVPRRREYPAGVLL